MLNAELVKTLLPGEVIEYGKPLSGLAPKEPVVWEVLEVVEAEDAATRRVTLRATLFGVYVGQAVGLLNYEKDSVKWKVTNG